MAQGVPGGAVVRTYLACSIFTSDVVKYYYLVTLTTYKQNVNLKVNQSLFRVFFVGSVAALFLLTDYGESVLAGQREKRLAADA